MRLFSLLSFLILYTGRSRAQASSPEKVTLWQFGGAQRFHAGSSTEPLRVLGVASDGLSTTYLDEVVNVETTIGSSDSIVVTSTITASRTIVASASGWIENFGTTFTIECEFTNSEEGKCFDETSTATGAPSAYVFAVHTGVDTGVTTSSTTEAPTTPVQVATTSFQTVTTTVVSTPITSEPSPASSTSSTTEAPTTLVQAATPSFPTSIAFTVVSSPALSTPSNASQNSRKLLSDGIVSRTLIMGFLVFMMLISW